MQCGGQIGVRTDVVGVQCNGVAKVCHGEGQLAELDEGGAHIVVRGSVGRLQGQHSAKLANRVVGLSNRHIERPKVEYWCHKGLALTD